MEMTKNSAVETHGNDQKIQL